MKTKLLATPAFGLAFAIMMLVVASCDNDVNDDVGTVTINLGASAVSAPGARAVAAWPPDEAGILKDITHIITLSSTGQANITHTLEGGGEVSIPNVRTGWWTVSVEAYYYKASIMYAEGSDDVEVIADKENPVTIIMKPVFLPYFASNTAEWEAVVDDIIERAPNPRDYRIIITEDFNINPITDSSYTFGSANDIGIVIGGIYPDTPTISLSGNGSLLRIGNWQNVRINDLTLKGSSTNDAPLVYINGTNFSMYNGCTLTGNNTSDDGGGVYVNNGNFYMYGGLISDNTASGNGGGVYVGINASFNMNGGVISGNTANEGGGMYIDSDGTFRIMNGTIYGATATGTDANTALSNSGAALNVSGTAATAEHGTFDAINTWQTTGTFTTTDDTITVVDGVLQP